MFNEIFKLGSLCTFKFSFSYEGFIVSEYIHGLIAEHSETDRGGNIVIIKISQISNLADYLDGKEVSFVERTFRMSELELIINYK